MAKQKSSQSKRVMGSMANSPFQKYQRGESALLLFRFPMRNWSGLTSAATIGEPFNGLLNQCGRLIRTSSFNSFDATHELRPIGIEGKASDHGARVCDPQQLCQNRALSIVASRSEDSCCCGSQTRAPAKEIHGDRSRPGCGSVRPRAEHCGVINPNRFVCSRHKNQPRGRG